MGVKVSVKVDADGVLRKVRRIVTDRRVGQFAADDAARLMEQYVPFRVGALRGSAVTSPFMIEYTAPYAHKQWDGEGIDDDRRTTPGTVSHWEEYVDEDELASDVTEYIRTL